MDFIRDVVTVAVGIIVAELAITFVVAPIVARLTGF